MEMLNNEAVDLDSSLNLSNAKLEMLNVDQFAKFPQLKILKISNNKINKIDMSIFDKLTQLTQINFVNNPISTFKSNIFMKYSKLMNVTNEIQKFVVNIDNNYKDLHSIELTPCAYVKENNNFRLYSNIFNKK